MPWPIPQLIRSSLFVLFAAALPIAAQVAPVAIGPSGRLLYHPLETGDRVMDFSYAGYHGGGVALPQVPLQRTVAPSGRDDSAAIQAALDAVAALPAIDGLRGAVVLAPGDFTCAEPLQIKADGVVLRGSGEGKTTIHLAAPAHTAVVLGEVRGEREEVPESGTPLTEAHVPAGGREVGVADGSSFHPGEPVAVVRPVSAHWVAFMGMDHLERDGKHETWVKGSIVALRTVEAVSGNRLTLDVPLSDDIDVAEMGGGAYIADYTPPQALREVGVEELSIVAPVQHVKLTDKAFSGIHFGRVSDAWIRHVSLRETMGTIGLGHLVRRVTVEGVHIEHSSAIIGAAKPADFSIDGTQVLVDRCTDRGADVFYLATGAGVTGPNVLLNCTFEGGGWIQPHQRWATGLLADNCHVPGGGIEFMNRGQMGSGHGWTIGWAVAWNCTAGDFVIQLPPGSMNWAVGCTGELKSEAMPFGKGPLLPNATIVSPGHPVEPASLYLAQLGERLGAQAVRAIGY